MGARFGLLLDRDDRDVLFQCCIQARRDDRDVRTVADAIGVFNAKYGSGLPSRRPRKKAKGKGVATKRGRNNRTPRLAKIKAGLSAYTGPIPPFPSAPLLEVTANARHRHFRRFDTSVQGLMRLHCAGRGLTLEDVTDEVVSTIIGDDQSDVLQAGCSVDGCPYSDGPWRPSNGMRSPYATERGSVEMVCLAHSQLLWFAKE